MDQPKIERLLRLMQYLSGNSYYTIDELSVKLEITRRTIYRYLDTFKNVGFAVQRINDGVYRMANMRNSDADLSKIVYFSEEEAFVVNGLIDALDDTNAMKNELKLKLSAVYEATNIKKYTINKGVSKTIGDLSAAIKHKRMVVLHHYASSRSNTVKDYQVEPFVFTTNYLDVWAFDVNDKINKTFKVARIGEVEVLEKDWVNESAHQEEPTDSFRSHSSQTFHVKLKLTQVAKNRMVEDFPLTAREIIQDKDAWYYEGDVRSMEGVGRFVLSLPEHITILEGEEVRQYVREKADYILKEMLQ
jgi:predicted DNA-binding transcriptional regulator YafY